MGRYSERLAQRLRAKRRLGDAQAKRTSSSKGNEHNPEKPRPDHYIAAAAIIREGEITTGQRSHAQLRRQLGDEDCYQSRPSDREGFIDNHGQFHSRLNAARIAQAAGQAMFGNRPLLSSDVTWFD